MEIYSKKTLYIMGSFLAGFSLMTVELVSSRIVAPIIGSSVFTWTSVIGITLLGLSLGSWIGGTIADKRKSGKFLPLSFLVSSILVSLIPILAKNTDFITNSSDSILKLNLFLSIYLFLLPSLAIGLIQPIILKEYADDFSKIGSRYGILSAVWSIGSVLGVFLTGFFFISNIGSMETIWLISIILFLIGLIFSIGNKKMLLFFLLVVIVVPIILYLTLEKTDKKSSIVFQKETNYYDAMVLDRYIWGIGKSRILFLDADSHSIETQKPYQYFYTEMYPVFGDLKNNIKNILVIGAGAYTMPEHFKDYYKNAEVSVIETDPEMITIGNDYFNLKKYDIKTLVGDAKTVIAKDTTKYDVIFGDAYNSFISVPWYLLTKEWNTKIKERLNDDGIYAINFIGSVTGEDAKITESIANTFKLSFPNFYVFSFDQNKENIQNIVLVGINGNLPISEQDLYQKLLKGENSFLANRLLPAGTLANSTSLILTDNFAPVEKLMEPSIKDFFSENLSFLKEINYPI